MRRVQIDLSDKQIMDYKYRIILLDQTEHKMKSIIDQNPWGQVQKKRFVVFNESLVIYLYLEIEPKRNFIQREKRFSGYNKKSRDYIITWWFIFMSICILLYFWCTLLI